MERNCGTCRWRNAFTGACCNSDSEYRADFTERESVCGAYTPKTCATCRHYLGGGYCGSSLERECAESGYEAWEAE